MSHLFAVQLESFGSQQLLSFFGPSLHVHEPLIQACRVLHVWELLVVVVSGPQAKRESANTPVVRANRIMGKVSFGVEV